MKSRSYIFLLITILLLNYGCTEIIEVNTQDFENILVINANITDKNTKHEITLTRTYEAGSTNLNETGASVFVIDNLDNLFQFIEETSGNYISNEPFNVIQGRSYQLNVTTKDGNQYYSDFVAPIANAKIEDLRAEFSVDELGNEGVAIKIDGYDPENKAKYFRFEYEETYLIESAIVSYSKLNIISENPPEVEIITESIQNTLCYNTLFSNEILTISTEQEVESRFTNYQLKFISKNDFRIRNRYSLLVHQYVQSREANSFYSTLKDFASSDNLLSQTQPGFITGNIKSKNSAEKVIGFFEVSTVNSKRIFFNYDDVIPPGARANYPFDCTPLKFTPNEIGDMINLLKTNNYVFTSFNYVGSVYSIVNRPCIDCTVLGVKEKPEFWID
ncbi:hypothetical protein Celal_3647 [Cellulophaga algicola DSM 14237]|uniref:DUF4249 domain-containing protein n=1 Tax=Cellulophaga algicola (strain DSM 14237 / IC166 / ACAM 630) TaxID=688270 RepID=E6X992_CELAD|nr:DUF4249 domain-containing protein [Cellulophaga algicola]ADV50902.1 hypothetical protein Celal_3647 [Cellulophaga algicola DSM 14237]